MSILGLIGLGFGSGGSSDYPSENDVRLGTVYANGTLAGNLVLPAVNKVREGIKYGSNGTEFTGTFHCGPPVPPVGIATQGVQPQALLDAFASYLQLITGLPERRIILWCFPGRPPIEGSDWLVWYRPDGETDERSEGPVRYGNKFGLTLSVNVLSRNMVDGSQRDTRKLPPHYVRRWKITDAMQNLHLFSAYTPPPDPPAHWYPPQPADGAYPLTVEPMLLNTTPSEIKDQFEEATIMTSFSVLLPAVLALDV